MALQVVHSPEDTPETLTKSVFLVGPSPREASHPNWRPQAVEALAKAGYDGTVFLPVPRDGKWPQNYLDQVQWEQRHLNLADVVAVWCPRDLEKLPAFTTNVEFGELLTSGKMIYGRPDGAPKTRYLDARYQQLNRGLKPPQDRPCNSLDQLARQCVERIGEGSKRQAGERFVPLNVWRSRQFQAWYADLVAAGNRLDGASVLWTFHIPQANNFLLCYSIRVKVWVAAEKRHKENEYVLSRTDISSVCAFARDQGSHEMLDTKIVLVKEFRSPARTGDGFLHELPGGSSFKASVEDATQVAADELRTETGIDIPAKRFRAVTDRQLAGTFGSHKAFLFAVELTGQEIAAAERQEREGKSFGDRTETELTYIEVRTLRQILAEKLLDYATVGMIMQACLGEWTKRD